MFGLLHGRTRRNLCGDPPTECWRHRHGIQENPDEMFGSVNVLDVHPVHGPDQRMGRNGRSGTTPLCTKSIDLGSSGGSSSSCVAEIGGPIATPMSSLNKRKRRGSTVFNDFRSMRHNPKGHRQRHRSRRRKAVRQMSLRPADSFRRILFPADRTGRSR